jgi:hypothetical protein
VTTYSRPGKRVDPDIPILKEAKAEYAKLQWAWKIPSSLLTVYR